jgi:hypothetical protein
MNKLGIYVLEELKTAGKVIWLSTHSQWMKLVTSEPAQLIFIRVIYALRIHDEVTISCSLHTTTTGEVYFWKYRKHLLLWNFVGEIWQVWRPMVMALRRKSMTMLCDVSFGNPMVVHCVIHQDAMCCKNFPLERKRVTNAVVLATGNSITDATLWTTVSPSTFWSLIGISQYWLLLGSEMAEYSAA